MSSIDCLYADLSRIASSMEALAKKEHAEAFYDTFSGSLVWPDELPRHTGISLDCLRFVLKYRTGLIVGEPQPSFELFWQEAARRFPNWIGFDADRIAPSKALTDFYLRERKRIEAET